MNENTQPQNPIPPPPPPEIGIRTMKSDLESIRQSGGEAPTPQVFIPEELKPKIPPPAIKEPEAETVLNVPGYTGPEKPIFESQPAISIPKSALAPINQSRQTAAIPKKSALKIIALIVGAIIVLAGLGLLGYYVIFPLFFPAG